MKRIIVALTTLLISFVILTTASYAWFSLNQTVSVTNMQITANSDSVYLLISEVNTTAAGIQSEKKTTIAQTVSPDNAKVYPSAYEVTDGTDFADESNWYTANSNDPASSAINLATKTALTDFDGYVITYTYYFTLAVGSNPAKDLIVSSYSIAMNDTADGTNETIAPMKTVVVCGSVYEELTSTDTEGSVVLYSSNITDESVVQVDVYIYFDGNDTNVYTNNIANLEGASIDIEFSVVPA